MLFNPANISYWIFLGIGVSLFLLVILSGGSDEDLDADDGLGEINTDGDLDADGDFSFNFLPILGWLGIGKAPLILLLAVDFSAWGSVGWMLNVAVASAIGSIPVHFLGLGGVILISSLVISLFCGSLIARPLGRIFASFGEDVSSERLIGCVGTLSSSKLPYLTSAKVGQADVLDSAQNLVTVSVALPQWATVIPHRGQQVLIIDQQKHSYIAIAKDTSDEDKWLNTRKLS